MIGVAGLLGLAACGGDDTDSTGDAPPASAGDTATGANAGDDGYGGLYGEERADAPATTAGGSASSAGTSVSTGETSVGTVLVDTDGFTLYGFLADGDANGEPTCVDDCAGAWPPALVEGEPNVGDLDPDVFTVVEHPDGPMLKAGDWPLYRFAGDAAPGDANGQGSGDVWFAVAPDGTLID